MLNGLDLFSGYGGISLALREWVRPIAYCERERYAQGILLSRIAGQELPAAPIWDDVRTLDGSVFRHCVDIIYGGFPCQDISVAGLGKGLEGERSGLFYEVCRLAEEIEPTFIFLENVPAIRTRGLREVARALSDLGYDLRWHTLSASEVGAPHKRDRWFLLAAHAERIKLRYIEQRKSWRQSNFVSTKGKAKLRDNGSEEFMANSDGQRSGSFSKISRRPDPLASGIDWWAIEPDVVRVVDGHSSRVDRIKAIGNGVVPLQVQTAFKELMGLT